MFKRGDVVQHTTERWIGVVTLDGADGLIVKWFEGRTGGGMIDRTLITPVDGYEFEAALALGDTETVLKLYRAAQAEQSKQEQRTEAKARSLQAGINVIGHHLTNSTDEVVRELTGEKPYFMPGIITAVQFLVDAHTKLQTALTPFARFGKLQHRYANEALFTIAYDRNGTEVVIRYADFVRAAELVADVETTGQGGEQIGGRGGIAEIMEDSAPQTLLGKPVVYRELTDPSDFEGKILRVIQPRRATIVPRHKQAKFGYRVRFTSANNEPIVGRIAADSEDEALTVFAQMVQGATNLEVIETIPLDGVEGAAW